MCNSHGPVAGQRHENALDLAVGRIDLASTQPKNIHIQRIYSIYNVYIYIHMFTHLEKSIIAGLLCVTRQATKQRLLAALCKREEITARPPPGGPIAETM